MTTGIGIFSYRQTLLYSPYHFVKGLLSSSRRYPYRPLAHRYTRLLRITKYPREQEFLFGLVHFSLDDLPSYGALSYTWGDAVDLTYYEGAKNEARPREYIKCDGYNIHVTENLMDFFTQLHAILDGENEVVLRAQHIAAHGSPLPLSHLQGLCWRWASVHTSG